MLGFPSLGCVCLTDRFPAGAYRLFVVVGRPRLWARVRVSPWGPAWAGLRSGGGGAAGRRVLGKRPGPGCFETGRPGSQAILNFTHGRKPVPWPGGAGHVSAGDRPQPLGRRSGWRRPPGRLFCVVRRGALRAGPPAPLVPRLHSHSPLAAAELPLSPCPALARRLRLSGWPSHASRRCAGAEPREAFGGAARSGRWEGVARRRPEHALRLHGRPLASAYLCAPERGCVGVPHSAVCASRAAGCGAGRERAPFRAPGSLRAPPPLSFVRVASL